MPSRAFVGMVVFGLIATLALVPYTVLVLSGYHPQPGSPQESLFGGTTGFSAGDKAVLVLGSLFSVVLTVASWRGLLGRARHDAKRRRDLQEVKAQPPPPGYQ